MRVGKELEENPEYQRCLTAGEIAALDASVLVLGIDPYLQFRSRHTSRATV